MWTALGVMFFIGAAGWGIIKAVGIFIIGSGLAASGKGQAQKKIDAAREEQRRRETLRQQRTMTQDFRMRKMQEEPLSVKVGEMRKTEYINRPGCVSIYGKKHYESVTTYDDLIFYPGCKDEGRTAPRLKRKVNSISRDYYGYTDSLYKYLSEVDLIDSMTPREWFIKTNTLQHPEKLTYASRRANEERLKHPPKDEAIINTAAEDWNNDCYKRARERQITEYCETVSMLAHRYIYFGAYSEFKEYFIRVLIGDRGALMNFLHECHTANMWKEQYEQLYDCENYMQDFMKDNNIQEKMNALAGHEVLMPDDFRHYREQSPNKTVANHINHELAREGRGLQKAEIELHSKKGWRTAFVVTFIGIALIAGALYLFSQNRDSIQWTIWVLAIYALFWSLMVAAPATDGEDIKTIEKQEEEEKEYVNPSPYPLNEEGKKFAEHLYKEILEEHPAPYKFYEAVEAAMSPPSPEPEEQSTESQEQETEEQEQKSEEPELQNSEPEENTDTEEKKEKKMDRKAMLDEVSEIQVQFIEEMVKLCDKYGAERTSTIRQCVDDLRILANRFNFEQYEVRKQ